jgi:hypothetical protein
MTFNALIYNIMHLEIICITSEHQLYMTASKNAVASSEKIGNKNIENKIVQINKETLKETAIVMDQPEFLKKKEIIKVLNDVNKITQRHTEPQKNPTIIINSIDTHILIKKDKTEGEVLEKVKFTLKDGVFNSIVRKVSLGGTSDRHFGFRLASA